LVEIRHLGLEFPFDQRHPLVVFPANVRVRSSRRCSIPCIPLKCLCSAWRPDSRRSSICVSLGTLRREQNEILQRHAFQIPVRSLADIAEPAEAVTSEVSCISPHLRRQGVRFHSFRRSVAVAVHDRSTLLICSMAATARFRSISRGSDAPVRILADRVAPQRSGLLPFPISVFIVLQAADGFVDAIALPNQRGFHPLVFSPGITHGGSDSRWRLCGRVLPAFRSTVRFRRRGLLVGRQFLATVSCDGEPPTPRTPQRAYHPFQLPNRHRQVRLHRRRQPLHAPR